MSQLAIRRDGGLIRVTLKGRIQQAVLPRVPRIEAVGTVIGDLVDVDLRISAEEARRAAETLTELARQIERHLRNLVIAPQA